MLIGLVLSEGSLTLKAMEMEDNSVVSQKLSREILRAYMPKSNRSGYGTKLSHPRAKVDWGRDLEEKGATSGSGVECEMENEGGSHRSPETADMAFDV
jgi:hypothetical protein